MQSQRIYGNIDHFRDSIRGRVVFHQPDALRMPVQSEPSAEIKLWTTVRIRIHRIISHPFRIQNGWDKIRYIFRDVSGGTPEVNTVLHTVSIGSLSVPSEAAVR